MEKSIFANLPNELIMKILEHKKFEEEKDLNKNRFKKVMYSIHLNTLRMWRHYDTISIKKYDDFMEQDYNIGWCLASIYNSKFYVDDSDDDR
jgi:hypothetical protein